MCGELEHYKSRVKIPWVDFCLLQRHSLIHLSKRTPVAFRYNTVRTQLELGNVLTSRPSLSTSAESKKTTIQHLETTVEISPLCCDLLWWLELGLKFLVICEVLEERTPCSELGELIALPPFFLLSLLYTFGWRCAFCLYVCACCCHVSPFSIAPHHGLLAQQQKSNRDTYLPDAPQVYLKMLWFKLPFILWLRSTS